LPSSTRRTRKIGSPKKESQPQEVALANVKDDFSKYLRLAAGKEIVITCHGRPAGVLIGFETEDDWFDYRLENHPEFLQRISESRLALRRGMGIRLENLDSSAGKEDLAVTKARRRI